MDGGRGGRRAGVVQVAPPASASGSRWDSPGRRRPAAHRPARSRDRHAENAAVVPVGMMAGFRTTVLGVRADDRERIDLALHRHRGHRRHQLRPQREREQDGAEGRMSTNAHGRSAESRIACLLKASPPRRHRPEHNSVRPWRKCLDSAPAIVRSTPTFCGKSVRADESR